MTLLITFTLFLLGAYGMRIRLRSAYEVVTSIGEQMDAHNHYRAVHVTTLLEGDPDMGAFELALLDGVWNRIAERCDRFCRRNWLARAAVGRATRSQGGVG